MSSDRERSPLAPPDLDDHLGILVLSAFAFAQPLFEITSRDPQLFLERATTPVDLLVVTFAVLLGPPAAFSIGTWVVGRVHAASGRAVAVAISALLVGAIVLPHLSRFLAPFPTAGLVAATITSLTWARFRRRPVVREFVRLLTPALVVFPVVFLSDPATRALLSPEGVGAIDVHEEQLAHPVVLLVFDELSLTAMLDSDDRIRSDLFPRFAALAEESHWFRGATTVHNFTVRAVPALVTGRFPDPASPRLLSYEGHPRNLLSWLRESTAPEASATAQDLLPPSSRGNVSERAGIRTLLHDLGWISLHAIIPRPWSSRLPALGDHGQAPSPGGEGPVSLFLESLRTIRSGGPPRVFLLHTLLPHYPLRYLPSGRTYNDPSIMPTFGPEITGGATWHGAEDSASAAFHRYRLQVAAADRMLGLLLDHLRETGLFQQALVVVTSDHGVDYRFSPGGARRRAPAHDVRGELLPIPLFFKLPGQTRGVVHDTIAETVDVLPTIADVLGLDVPWHVDGRSLLDSSAPSRPSLRFLFDRGDEEVPMELPADPEPRRAAAREWTRILGDPRPGTTSRFGWGPHADLVGTGLDETARGTPLEASAILEAPRKGPNGIDSGALPLHVVYRVDAAAEETLPRWWALAFGDRIGAVTPRETLADGGQRVAGVVAEELWEGRPRETALFGISESQGVRWLHAVESETAETRARAIFENLERRLVADSASDFDGVSAGPGTSIERSDRLLVASTISPSILVDFGVAIPSARLGVRLAFEAPRSTRVCINWQTDEDRRFWWTRTRCRQVEGGPADLTIAIESAETVVGPLRVELDSMAGTYLLERVEVRGSAEFPESSVATSRTR